MPPGAPVGSVSITPPQSANGKKDAPEGVPSELSDLELDAKSAAAHEDTPVKQEETEEAPQEEEVEPDHYYGGGKIPVFKPVSLSVKAIYGARKYSFALDNGSIPRLSIIHQQD